MIVVMQKGATEHEINYVVERVQSLGLRPHVIHGTERTVIAAIGDKRDEHRASLESCPGVAEVIPILAPYKVASLEVKPERTVVRVGPFIAGNSHIGVIAGPCSVETEEQTLSTARAVKAAGATALRGGAFKPRTSPYSFQGLKEDGLKILAAAREETGLPVVTEVITPADVPVVAKYADILQIGARNMQNYRLLEEARQAGPSEAGSGSHRRGTFAGSGIYSEHGQSQRDPLRTRHPHVRVAHALHAFIGHSSLASPEDAPSRHCGSQSRHRTQCPGAADGRCRGRRRCGWAHH